MPQTLEQMRTLIQPGPDLGLDHPVYAVDLSGLSTEERYRLFAKTAGAVVPQPALTTAVVIGQMQKRAAFPEFFAPPQTVQSIQVRRPTWPGDEWMERKDTKRAESSPYQTSHVTPSSETETLERHSWATMTDQRVLNNDPAFFMVGEKYAGLSARIVRKSFEYEVAGVLEDTTPGNTYAAGNITTLGAGDEFDAAAPSATPREVVDPLVFAICNGVGCEPKDLEIYLPLSTERALVAAADFKTWLRGQQAQVADPMLQNDIYARYFGVGRALVENAWGRDGGTTGPIFSDNLIISLPGVGGDYDTMFGERRHLLHLRMNAGIASEPFFDRKTSSQWWTWDEEWHFSVLDPAAAAIVVNTKA